MFRRVFRLPIDVPYGSRPWWAVGAPVRQAFRFRDRLVGVEEVVPLGVLKVVVRVLEVVHEEEWLLLVLPPFQPLERNVGNGIAHRLGIIATRSVRVLRPRLLAAGEEHRVEVGPLTGQHGVEVERRRLRRQVPLADHRRLVPRVFHQPGQELFVGFDAADEGADPVPVRVLPGEQGGPARRADRVRDEGVGEHRPFGGQPVQCGRRVELRQPPAVGADGLRRVVVGHEEQDVRLRVGRPHGGGQRRRRGLRGVGA